jgi:hypothetical protein
MTTDEKIAKIKWYIDVVKPHSEGSVKTYFLGLAQGVNNAWFLDNSITLAQYEEMNKLIDAI